MAQNAQKNHDQLNTYLLDKQSINKDTILKHSSPQRENIKTQQSQSSIITKKKKLRVIQHRTKFIDKIKSRAEYKDEIFTKPYDKNNEYQ